MYSSWKLTSTASKTQADNNSKQSVSLQFLDSKIDSLDVLIGDVEIIDDKSTERDSPRSLLQKNG